MTKYVGLLFAAGIAAIIVGGLQWGFDTTTMLLLALALGIATIGVAVVRKFSSGAVAPAQCAECGGLIAPSSPYCKHCGAAR
ncbi:MAG TPA: hypothetical protein VIG64_03430 [Actinomycetota bacterium]